MTSKNISARINGKAVRQPNTPEGRLAMVALLSEAEYPARQLRKTASATARIKSMQSMLEKLPEGKLAARRKACNKLAHAQRVMASHWLGKAKLKDGSISNPNLVKAIGYVRACEATLAARPGTRAERKAEAEKLAAAAAKAAKA